METTGRSLEAVKAEIRRRAGRINPFERAKPDDVASVLERLESLDPDLWGREWARLGRHYESLGEEQEKLGNPGRAGAAFYQAYEYYRIGRYPVPGSPEKMNCYRSALRCFLRAAPCLDPPAERVEIPFEGKKVVGYLQVPGGLDRPPVVMHWGGVDGWKEDRRSNSEMLHKAGLATFTIDMPGTGENPCLGQDPRAERTFSAALDYLETRSDIDGRRVAVMGGSFGGYWATKLAYVEAGRLRGAVNWGAGCHLTFQEEWLRPALTVKASQYLMGPASLLEARAYVFRAATLEEVLRIAPGLSLLAQGILDRPSAPLLCINGKEDDQHPVEDIYLLLEHGSPKDVRIIPGAGHMGRKPAQRNDEVQRIVTEWLKQRLAR
ncbi:MAG TPA: alpha/beta fold hydrolase [candidate division Zixibacteria bacterium]|nr:alpha/beta fold hydrolase [candidate division Zixibacteria bacterium]